MTELGRWERRRRGGIEESKEKSLSQAARAHVNYVLVERCLLVFVAEAGIGCRGLVDLLVLGPTRLETSLEGGKGGLESEWMYRISINHSLLHPPSSCNPPSLLPLLLHTWEQKRVPISAGTFKARHLGQAIVAAFEQLGAAHMPLLALPSPSSSSACVQVAVFVGVRLEGRREGVGGRKRK